MERFAGLTPTGREIKAPAATLVELEDTSGVRHTAIRYDDPYLGLPELTLNVELVLGFLQYPMVVGLVEMSHHDLASGTFVYPTGHVWTLKEILRIYQDASQVVGLRAGIELAYLGAQVLKEASETGPIQGCFSHGALNPWRISIRTDGQVQIIGYGLPQVELISHRRDPEWPIPGDSVRYCPPERLEGMPEDLAADTCALILIAYEVITGKPLYDGHDVDALKKMVALSEGTTLLSRARGGLPDEVANLFARALIFDPDTRLSGDALLGELESLLRSGPSGPSLEQVAEKLLGSRKKRSKRRGAKLVSTGTEAYTPEQLKALAEEQDDTSDEDEDADDPRWSRPSRSKDEDEDEDEDEDDEKKPRRRRRRGSSSARTSSGEPRRRRRRSRSSEGDDDDPEKKPRRRRRRRSSSGVEAEKAGADDTVEDEDEDEDEAEAPAEEEVAPKKKRRRRSSSKAATSSRRRRRKKEEEPEPEPEPNPDDEATSVVDPAQIAAAEAEAEAEAEADEKKKKKKPRRRRRSSSGAPKKSSRRRRKKKKDDED